LGYPLIYKINSGPTPSLTLIANLSSDGQGVVNYQGICYFNQSLYVPRKGQITKIDLADNNQVSRFAGTGTSNPVAVNGQKLDAVFYSANHCTTDKDGNIYVGESNAVIRKISTTGYVSTVATVSGGIFGMILDSSGNLIVSIYDLVQSVNLTNKNVLTIVGIRPRNSSNYGEEGPALAVSINPGGLTCDEGGNLYFAQISGDGLIYKVNTANYTSKFVKG
jgi:hypothetical protein